MKLGTGKETILHDFPSKTHPKTTITKLAPPPPIVFPEMLCPRPSQLKIKLHGYLNVTKLFFIIPFLLKSFLDEAFFFIHIYKV